MSTRPSPPPAQRVRVRRHPERGSHDRGLIDSILDEALICHLAVVHDGGPRVIPTIHVRAGDTLYVHGSTASRTLRSALDGVEACVAVTIIDGLVLARSAFNHSMNYRSVIVYGRMREVTDPEEKWGAQRALVDHVVPGRADDVRDPNQQELRQTRILALELTEASAKVRTGPPIDDDDDLELPIWAGELPLRTVAGEPLADPGLVDGPAVPANVRDYRRPG